MSTPTRTCSESTTNSRCVRRSCSNLAAAGKPDLALPAAAKLLQDRRTQRLFVVDGEQALVGVLTRGDVVRALAEAGA